MRNDRSTVNNTVHMSAGHVFSPVVDELFYLACLISTLRLANEKFASISTNN